MSKQNPSSGISIVAVGWTGVQVLRIFSGKSSGSTIP
jgi:hypothetical protein